MSADNWAICPRCAKAAAKSAADRVAEAQKAYGKVEPSEYLRLVAEASKDPDPEETATFREDYGIGVDPDGEFTVTYTGSCQKCSLRHTYKHCEQLVFDPPATLTVAEPKRKGAKPHA